MTAARTALVIGGGIAGPVTAMALRKAGVEATVYEAYPSAADGVGVTLTVAPNGLAALRVIGAEDAVLGIGQPLTRAQLCDGRGERLGDLPGLPGLPPSRGLWRDELCRVLHETAEAQGVRVEYGKRLVGAEESPEGVTAHFADGTSATADVLVGADGIRSTVRTLIDPAAPEPETTRLLNFGAAADIAVPADRESAYFVFGARGFFGYWVQPDDRTAWFANLPHDRPLSSAEARATAKADWLARLRDLYAGDTPCREILAHTDADALTVLGSLENMPKVPAWHRGRMVLVGDSAHAPSSSSGQGASQAIESAVQLARCLRDLPDPQSAFAAYERLRRTRAEKVIDRGNKTNNSKTMGPVAKKMMKLMMPLMMKTFLNPEKTLGPEQRYTIDWDAPATSPEKVPA
ncbi:FAD-dependent monooxygenase [Actinomadura livida]|uniref:2-polyprenyl-6-methoxyphenol hydroxylase-like FAD-dependent oxidoreductase n=1 Tax=Actinomadura livida TaxID=79909 RepID=A0A7W7I7Z4_9ACTN|nr:MULTISPECIES: FAD-dependent monooxygenase [Actinomadura]MBB4772108.1 2-polyprenyl-6-methoxyphenol hydroxylase-like FAD-dependent oxidoreductase [Actinomadura catellatispora]GGU37396.1 FAD-dependent oxidoreductase [Actinomadura livida]